MSFTIHGNSSLSRRLQGVADHKDIDDFEAETREVRSEQLYLSTELTRFKVSRLRSIVLEVLRPFWGTERVVNMDNYYSSPQLFRQLHLKGIYARGTLRMNRKHTPSFLAFSTRELKTLERGSFKYAVLHENEFSMLAASWIDGDDVTLLSTADASSQSTVYRNVGAEKTPFSSLQVVNEYNENMGGVDVADQYRARFSISDGHTFKKWHKKLAMSIIDMVRCNAFASFSLAHPELKVRERDPHRWFVQELINGLFIGMCFLT